MVSGYGTAKARPNMRRKRVTKQSTTSLSSNRACSTENLLIATSVRTRRRSLYSRKWEKKKGSTRPLSTYNFFTQASNKNRENPNKSSKKQPSRVAEEGEEPVKDNAQTLTVNVESVAQQATVELTVPVIKVSVAEERGSGDSAADEPDNRGNGENDELNTPRARSTGRRSSRRSEGRRSARIGRSGRKGGNMTTESRESVNSVLIVDNLECTVEDTEESSSEGDDREKSAETEESTSETNPTDNEGPGHGSMRGTRSVQLSCTLSEALGSAARETVQFSQKEEMKGGLPMRDETASTSSSGSQNIANEQRLVAESVPQQNHAELFRSPASTEQDTKKSPLLSSPDMSKPQDSRFARMTSQNYATSTNILRWASDNEDVRLARMTSQPETLPRLTDGGGAPGAREVHEKKAPLLATHFETLDCTNFGQDFVLGNGSNVIETSQELGSITPCSCWKVFFCCCPLIWPCKAASTAKKAAPLELQLGKKLVRISPVVAEASIFAAIVMWVASVTSMIFLWRSISLNLVLLSILWALDVVIYLWTMLVWVWIHVLIMRKYRVETAWFWITIGLFLLCPFFLLKLERTVQETEEKMNSNEELCERNWPEMPKNGKHDLNSRIELSTVCKENRRQ